MTTAIYFSATDTTRKITEKIASYAPEGFSSVNITHAGREVAFTSDDCVVIGAPVYAGRIPEIAAGRFASVSGNGARCVVVVVYGNRDYDDALLELCDIAVARGFNVVAAGAFIAEHCVFPQVAAGRPDDEDMADIERFATACLGKTTPLDLSKVKGNRPYKTPSAIPLHPVANKELCNACGACASQCPVDAIDKNHPQETDNGKCITCCRCIHVCPQGARTLSGLMYKLAGLKFVKAYSARRLPEWHL